MLGSSKPGPRFKRNAGPQQRTKVRVCTSIEDNNGHGGADGPAAECGDSLAALLVDAYLTQGQGRHQQGMQRKKHVVFSHRVLGSMMRSPEQFIDSVTLCLGGKDHHSIGFMYHNILRWFGRHRVQCSLSEAAGLDCQGRKGHLYCSLTLLSK
jgi:hypothetical protein